MPDDTADDGGDRATVTVGAEGYDPDADEPADGGSDEFGWRGWVLVGLLVLSFIVLPGIVMLRPLRLVAYDATFIALPLLPAMLLGAVAVWSAVRSRQG